MNKGTLLYVGNFELPDKGASANRVMSNRLLFRELGYRTAFLGVTRAESFAGIRTASFAPDVFERAYPASTRTWLERSYSLKDVIALAERYDDIKAVIFYNSPISLARRAYGYFSKRGIKVLYDCTEWNAYTKGNKLKQLYKRLDAHQIQYRLDKCVDGLLVISTLMYRQYRTKPIVLLPPLVDCHAPMWRQGRARNDGIFEFCYAGDPEQKDDLRRLIDAFAALGRENTRLRIIGLRKEDFLQENSDYVPPVECAGTQICFTGRISHEEVIWHLAETDCFVFLRESNLRNNAGFPTKFSEAYTSGVQIIATDISDLRSYDEDSVQIVSDMDVATIRNAMACAMTHKRADGVRDAFDYRRYVEPMRDFFKPLMDETTRRVK